MWPPQERDSKPTRTHHSLKLIILYAIAYPRGISKSPRSIILSRDIRRTQAVESGASNEAKRSRISQNPSKPREKVKAALHSAAATSLPMTSPLLRHHRRRLLSTCTRALKCLSRSISWNPVRPTLSLLPPLSLWIPFPKWPTSMGPMADGTAAANPSLVCVQIGDGAALGRLHHCSPPPGRRGGGEVLRRGALPAAHEDPRRDRPCRRLRPLHHPLPRRYQGADR